MYVYQIVEQLKVSTDLKVRVEKVLDSDDTYTFEIQDYLQKIYKVEKEFIEKLIALEQHDKPSLT